MDSAFMPMGIKLRKRPNRKRSRQGRHWHQAEAGAVQIGSLRDAPIVLAFFSVVWF
jgi:hypothetical protein